MYLGMRQQYNLDLTFNGFLRVAIRLHRFLRLSLRARSEDFDAVVLRYVHAMCRQDRDRRYDYRTDESVINRMTDTIRPVEHPVTTYERVSHALACDGNIEAREIARQIDAILRGCLSDDAWSRANTPHEAYQVCLDVRSLTLSANPDVDVPPAMEGADDRWRRALGSSPTSEQLRIPTRQPLPPTSNGIDEHAERQNPQDEDQPASPGQPAEAPTTNTIHESLQTITPPQPVTTEPSDDRASVAGESVAGESVAAESNTAESNTAESNAAENIAGESRSEIRQPGTTAREQESSTPPPPTPRNLTMTPLPTENTHGMVNRLMAYHTESLHVLLNEGEQRRVLQDRVQELEAENRRLVAELAAARANGA